MASKNRLVKCPKCGCDVVEVGFTTHSVQSETWMRIGGDVMKIATTQRASDEVYCNCGALLPMKAVELLRVAH